MKPKNNRIMIAAQGSGQIRVSPEIESDENVLAGTKLKFTAVPDPGWHFAQWHWAELGGNSIVSDGTANEDGSNTKEFTMPDSSVEVHALFARDTVDVLASEGLEVLYVNNGGDPYHDTGELVKTEKGKNVPKGSVVIVRAKAGVELADDAVWNVSAAGESGPAEVTVNETMSQGRSACKFTLPEDAVSCSVSAETAQGRFTVDAETEGVQFTVSVDGQEMEGTTVDGIASGSQVDITAKVTDRGKRVSGWIINGETKKTTDTLYRCNITENMSVAVTTEPVDAYSLKIAAEGGGVLKYVISSETGEVLDTQYVGENDSGYEAAVYVGESVLFTGSEENEEFTVDLTAGSKNTYTLSEDAEGQLKDISVKKAETEEDEELAGEQKNAEGEDAEINKSDDNLSENCSREGRTEEADFTKKAVKNGSDGDAPELNAPVVTWDGMSVKWDSVAGATSYEYTYYCSENPEDLIIRTTTDTQLDLSEFIETNVNQYWTLYFGVKVKARNETTESAYSYYNYKTFHKITVRADTESISGETTTDGKSGTVSGNGFSEFDPETASISGIFEDNAKITVTAVPNEGYEFKSFDGAIVDKKTNPVQNLKVNYSSVLWATFKELPSTLTVTLEMGSDHADLADSVLKEYLNGKDPDLYSGTVDGSLITLQIPNAGEDGYFEVGDLQRELGDDIQFVSHGNVLGFLGVGKKTIDNYSDQRELYEETSSRDAIQNNQKFYALWAKPITDCTITALPLLCGTELTYGDDASEYIQCTPNNVGLHAVWMPEDEEPSEEEPEEGETITVIGDKKYNIGIEISAPFGYYIEVVDGKPNIKYSNVEEVQSGSFGPLVFVLGKVTAQHSMGDWTITKEPSFTEEGLKTRTCACKEKTERVIIDTL